MRALVMATVAAMQLANVCATLLTVEAQHATYAPLTTMRTPHAHVCTIVLLSAVPNHCF